MHFEAWEEPATMERHYKLVITNADLIAMRLDNFDRLVLRDCEGADRTISDKLLALELMARRIEQGRSSQKEG